MTILRKGSWFIGRYTGESESARLKAGATPPPGGKSYAPDKLVDVLHIKLEVSFDLADRAVHGTATHTISPLSDGLDHLVLDCVELTV